MLHYIKAENLKCRKTFAKRLVFIAPVFTLLLSGAAGSYFVESGYNWWYVIVLPGFISLSCALVDQIEERKLHYRAVFTLPFSLQEVWLSKVSLLSIYIATGCVLHFLGIVLGKAFFNPLSAITFMQMMKATAILIIVSLWQIPFCLYLAKRFNLMAAVLLNVGVGTAADILTSTKTYWWLFPHGWGSRLMCPVLGILPNGLVASQVDPLLNPDVLWAGVLLSSLSFLMLTALTGVWFQRQEAV